MTQSSDVIGLLQSYLPMGVTTSVLVTGEDSGGALSMMESRAAAGWPGPPLHRHAFDAGFYVLAGELTLQVGGRFLLAAPGDFAFAPAGVDHTLANLTGDGVRYLVIYTPAGSDGDFEAVGPTIRERARLGRRERPAAVPGPKKVLLQAADGGGRVAVTDSVVPAGAKERSPGQEEFDETFYVLERELTFELGGEVLTRGAGQAVCARRGVRRAWANESGADARHLVVRTSRARA